MKKYKATYYLNGRFIPEDQAKISVTDIGLLRGFGVFDFLVTYKNRPFLIDEHINRLFTSASLIGLDIGKTKTQIKQIILKTLLKNSVNSEKTVRILITGGIGETSIIPSSNSTIAIIVQPKHDYPDKYYSEGVKIITFDYSRPMALAKSLDYAVAIRALMDAGKKKAIEALYINHGNNTITEATTSNIFMIKNNNIYTPKDNILNGITRNLVINLMKNRNPIVEKDISLKEFLISDEAFITASNKEVMPIIKIDNRQIGSGKVGPVTKNVMTIYRDFIENGKW